MYNERLWRGQEVLRLTPKAFAVLRYLVEHAGKLVTKDELLEAVWSATTVTEAALVVCIGEIRHILGDRPRSPQFIETVYGRGYRFIGKMQEAGVCNTALSERHDIVPLAPQLVGRETDYATLHHRFEQALRGERQVVFLTGEAGIGKTTLVEAFLDHINTTQAVWIGQGQCVDQYGAGEAYLPVLEALGRLCRQPEGQRFHTLLQQHAPSWLLQMPALLSTEAFETLQRRCLGTTPERMLRELAEAIEALTAERPLILVLEDLHWSDGTTLALLMFVARRPERARLLLIGTYRPMDVLGRDHPLLTVTQELQQHGQCRELPLMYLSEAAVTAYLYGRFLRRVFSRDLAQVLYRRTHGNPLFMVTIVDAMIRQGMLYEGCDGWALRGEAEHAIGDVPEGLRQYIEQQFHRLKPEDQEMLEAASLAGMEFSAATVAVVAASRRHAGSARLGATASPPSPAGASPDVSHGSRLSGSSVAQVP